MDAVLIVGGGSLLVGSLLAGLAQRTFLSLAAVFVGIGALFGDVGLEVLVVRPSDPLVVALAIVALVVVLFRDGIEVEQEVLLDHWHLPMRKLLLAMPLTAGCAACAAMALWDIDWTTALLIGAVVSPTDPILASAVVTNPRVPARIRHSLNLESGLNDGLALPAILILTAASADRSFVWWSFLLQDIGLGIVCGLVIAWVTAAMPRGDHSRHALALYALGTALMTFGIADAVDANGFIAVFVCAVALGIKRQDVAAAFEHGSSEIVEIVKLAVFVCFGAMISWAVLSRAGWSAVAFALLLFVVVRPLAVAVSLLGAGVDRRETLFLGWFGPRGISTMAFSLLVLSETDVADGGTVFSVAAVTIMLSIVLHGLTDTLGARWISAAPEPDDEEHLVPGVDPTLLTTGAAATALSLRESRARFDEG